MNGSGKNTTSFTFTGLANGTEYTLAIRASNLSGNGVIATVIATPSQWAAGPQAPAGACPSEPRSK